MEMTVHFIRAKSRSDHC